MFITIEKEVCDFFTENVSTNLRQHLEGVKRPWNSVEVVSKFLSNIGVKDFIIRPEVVAKTIVYRPYYKLKTTAQFGGLRYHKELFKKGGGLYGQPKYTFGQLKFVDEKVKEVYEKCQQNPNKHTSKRTLMNDVTDTYIPEHLNKEDVQTVYINYKTLRKLFDFVDDSYEHKNTLTDIINLLDEIDDILPVAIDHFIELLDQHSEISLKEVNVDAMNQKRFENRDEELLGLGVDIPEDEEDRLYYEQRAKDIFEELQRSSSRMKKASA